MNDELIIPNDEFDNAGEWHLEFTYDPAFPYPIPIVLLGTRPKHDPVGHLAADGTVHIFNTPIIERLVRAGLRARARRNGTA
jgi:hypothetical protein